eukprot:5595220-Pyramimonas_sp.AAC.1
MARVPRLTAPGNPGQFTAFSLGDIDVLAARQRGWKVHQRVVSRRSASPPSGPSPRLCRGGRPQSPKG